LTTINQNNLVSMVKPGQACSSALTCNNCFTFKRHNSRKPSLYAETRALCHSNITYNM